MIMVRIQGLLFLELPWTHQLCIDLRFVRGNVSVHSPVTLTVVSNLSLPNKGSICSVAIFIRTELLNQNIVQEMVTDTSLWYHIRGRQGFDQVTDN